MLNWFLISSGSWFYLLFLFSLFRMFLFLILLHDGLSPPNIVTLQNFYFNKNTVIPSRNLGIGLWYVISPSLPLLSISHSPVPIFPPFLLCLLCHCSNSFHQCDGDLGLKNSGSVALVCALVLIWDMFWQFWEMNTFRTWGRRVAKHAFIIAFSFLGLLL